MKKVENITSKIKHELEENEKKEKNLSDVLPDNPRSINMKNFWNNIDSLGFKKQDEGQIPNIKKNHRYLIPDIKSMNKVISKYIKTTPVSGSKKVNITGGIIISKIFNKNKNSSLIVGFSYFSLKLEHSLASNIISAILVNSLG